MQATLISAQRYRNDAIVQSKIDAEDYEVLVSPEFFIDLPQGPLRVRHILDGHHSYQAAIDTGVSPIYIEADATDNDTVSLIDWALDDYLTIHRIDSDYYDVTTGRDLF